MSTGRVRRPRLQRIAIALGAATAVALVAAVVLQVLSGHGRGGDIFVSIILLPWAMVGVIVARHQPTNPIGQIGRAHV